MKFSNEEEKYYFKQINIKTNQETTVSMSNQHGLSYWEAREKLQKVFEGIAIIKDMEPHQDRDILEAFKAQGYSRSSSETQKLVEDIGRELKAQEISRASEAAVMEM